MRPVLQDRHLVRFQALPVSVVPLVVRHLRTSRANPATRQVDYSSVVTGEDLWRVCRDAGLDHAGIVLTIAHETSLDGLSAIESLVGRPVRPWAATAREQQAALPRPAARGVAVVRERLSDLQVVSAVGPNPKKPGSSTHLRFAHWVVGRTVSDCMRAGLTRADVDWDVSRGFVTLAEPAAPGAAEPAEETPA